MSSTPIPASRPPKKEPPLLEEDVLFVALVVELEETVVFFASGLGEEVLIKSPVFSS